MIPQKIRDCYNSGETDVYNRQKGFDYSGMSQLGTHTLVITNYGRVIAYDTGGIFGTERVMHFDAKSTKLLISFSGSTVYVKSSATYPFKLDFTLNSWDFIDLFPNIPYECFDFPSDAKELISTLISYQGQSKTHMSLKLAAKFIEIIHQDDFVTNTFTVPLHRIETWEASGAHSLTLKGHFDIQNESISSIQLFIPQKEKLQSVKTLLQDAPRLSQLVGPFKSIYPITYRFGGSDSKVELSNKAATAAAIILGVVNSFMSNKTASLVYHDHGVVSFLDEDNWKVLHQFSLQNDEWYYDKKENRTIIVHNNKAFVVNMQRPDAIAFAKATWGSSCGVCVPQTGYLYGVYQQNRYTKDEVSMLVQSSNQIRLLHWKELQLSAPLFLQSCDIVGYQHRMFIFEDSSISMITWPDKKWAAYVNPKTPNNLDDVSFGITSMEHPFFIEQTMRGIQLRQSPDTVLHDFEYHAISDISIAEPEGDSFLVPCNISAREGANGSGTNRFMLPAAEVHKIIYATYYHAKAPLIERTEAKQIYLSWTRQVNDFALFHLFGQLLAIQAGIREIHDNVSDRDQRNHRLINFMYYAIQNQKRRLDQVSIYLPAMLDRNVKDIFEPSGNKHDEELFRQLQRGFMNVSVQIKSALNEVESALSAVSSTIIPKGDMDEIIADRAKRGYTQAAATTGVGLAIALSTGGLAIPFLLGGAFLGFNTAQTSKEAKRLEQMKTEMENHRLDFYMTKALDTFDHLMLTLLPYYVAEVNRHMVNCFERLAGEYRAAWKSPVVIENMFREITQLYTYKQLPIDATVVLRKKELMDTVQKAVYLSEQHIQFFQQEVNVHVLQQTEGPRLRNERSV
ncbi:hypothetical protein ACFFSY_03465 [Paenibacillus aurantiacus]|uniref:Uncharacterized protein n=1 Tax=Paenibacillus aurantiacus TaxID=1936118 RepID=A0ABV5KL59_9BACL